MEKMYEVLWIDDKWDKMTSFAEELEWVHKIKLSPFKTRLQGMKALEENLSKWDAILLDANIFDESENETPSIKGLRNAIDKINQLSTKRSIPKFISTGEPYLIDSNIFESGFGKYYIKGDDDERLIADIKQAISLSEDNQIRSIYPEVFDSLVSIKANNSIIESIFDILKALHFPAFHPDFRPLLYYNQLRQLIESIFRSCNNYGIIPDECIPGLVNINQCFMYLSGKEAKIAGVRYGEEGERIIPNYIENILCSVLYLGNTYSHYTKLTEKEETLLEAFFETAKSRFIIWGLTIQLFDVIIWFDKYIRLHQNKEENLLKVSKIEKIPEYEDSVITPEEDKENNVWHYKDCLLSISHWTGGQMRLKNIKKNTNLKTRSIYPWFANYEKVNTD